MKRLLTAFFGSSILWGSLAGVGFCVAARRGMIHNDLVVRYTTGHPVEYVTVLLFFIGMTSLFFKWLSVRSQKGSLALGQIFPAVGPEKEEASRADDYLESLDKAAEFRGETLHIGRLRKALSFLKSSGRADELDQELRCLADEDAIASEADYGMVRMFIWAIPILGFLGTVIGITQALGNLDLAELETTGKLLAEGLKIAFDTTALALSLVFVLYFTLFFVQKGESRLFTQVERLVNDELTGRFVSTPNFKEREEFRAIHSILKSVTDSFDKMTNRQVELWEDALNRAGKRGNDTLQKGAEQIHQTLRNSLQESVAGHARMMIAGEEKLLTETLTPFVRSMKENAERLSGLQDKMEQQEKLFRDILRATGEVTLLEDRLNHNLNALSEASCFSETVNSLAATIHLLNAKLGGPSFGAGNYRIAGVTGVAGATSDLFGARPLAETGEVEETEDWEEDREETPRGNRGERTAENAPVAERGVDRATNRMGGKNRDEKDGENSSVRLTAENRSGLPSRKNKRDKSA